MTAPSIQVASIVLPTVWTFGTEVENINDLVVHQGLTMSVLYLQEKMIHVVATEVVAVGAPGEALGADPKSGAVFVFGHGEINFILR